MHPKRAPRARNRSDPEGSRGLVGGVGPIAFTPDGKTLASAGGDQTVKLWDVETGDELRTLGKLPGRIWILRFSPDGRALATVSSNGPASTAHWVAFLWRAAEVEAEPTAPVPLESAKPAL